MEAKEPFALIYLKSVRLLDRGSDDVSDMMIGKFRRSQNGCLG